MTRSTKKVDEELQSTVKTLVIKLCTSKVFLSELTTSITETICKHFQEEITQLKKENKRMNKKLASQEEEEINSFHVIMYYFQEIVMIVVAKTEKEKIEITTIIRQVIFVCIFY
ncbi:hypothetical protein JTB14_012214 [Gonioctena quinquepunctata]|nr:hypothetical protein JTB14_012214 [Gonioctena quinquepunctata]